MSQMTQYRRDFLKSSSLLALAGAIGAGFATSAGASPDAPAKALLKQAGPLPAALPPGSVPGRKVKVNGVNYHVGEQGSGDKVVLMLHGMPDTSGVWRYQIPALVKAGYRVIAPDMLGYGLTDKPIDPKRYAGEQMIGDMLALIDALGLQQMDVVGHDWGGFISWELALNVPERFRRHLVISTGNSSASLTMPQSAEEVKANWYMYLNTQAAAAALYAANDGEFFKKILMPTHPEIDEVWSRLQDPQQMIGMLNWDRGNNVADYYLAAITGQIPARRCQVPTLGIWSSSDAYLWETQMTDSSQSMDAEWRYQRIDGGSHWVMLDHPQPVNELMLEWLAKS